LDSDDLFVDAPLPPLGPLTDQLRCSLFCVLSPRLPRRSTWPCIFFFAFLVRRDFLGPEFVGLRIPFSCCLPRGWWLLLGFFFSTFTGGFKLCGEAFVLTPPLPGPMPGHRDYHHDLASEIFFGLKVISARRRLSFWFLQNRAILVDPPFRYFFRIQFISRTVPPIRPLMLRVLWPTSNLLLFRRFPGCLACNAAFPLPTFYNSILQAAYGSFYLTVRVMAWAAVIRQFACHHPAPDPRVTSVCLGPYSPLSLPTIASGEPHPHQSARPLALHRGHVLKPVFLSSLLFSDASVTSHTSVLRTESFSYWVQPLPFHVRVR